MKVVLFNGSGFALYLSRIFSFQFLLLMIYISFSFANVPPHPVQQEKKSNQAPLLNSSSSLPQNEKMDFSRSLRAKYIFLDSLNDYLRLSYGRNLYFDISSIEFWEEKEDITFYPNMRRPLWDEDLLKRSFGGYRNLLINTNRLASSNPGNWEKGNDEFEYRFIPSNLQLDVLNVLWDQQVANQMDIYAEVDSGYTITAQQLDQQLKRMFKLGLVERKIVSPQHLFTVITPLRSFQIEMSARNPKNRVYNYRSLVEKDRILRLILRRYYQVKHENLGYSGEIERLRKKLKILLANGKEE